MSVTCGWLHGILIVLPIIRHPFDISKLPDNGVYFLYEDGEAWGHVDDPKPRIVRIGTHKDGNFKSRISEHFLLNESKMNFDKNKPAPHARSIFRKNLGRAILNKEKNDYLKVWEIDFTSRKNREKLSHLRDIDLEKRIETQITNSLRKHFSFRYLIVEGEEGRMGAKGLESKLIGTVAQCDVCKPSSNWLGNHSPKHQIKSSGLWLSQHLDSPPMNESDRNYVSKCLKDTMNWIKVQ